MDEMFLWIDNNIGYVNQILSNSEYFLILDQKRENEIKALQEKQE